MSPAHQEQFIQTYLIPVSEGWQHYVIQRKEAQPAVVSLGYRIARSTKGLILSSTEGLHYLAEASTNTTMRRLYQQWKAAVTEYASLALQERWKDADSVA